MATKLKIKQSKNGSEAMVYFPLGALRNISRTVGNKKIVVELSLKELKRVNDAATIDEIINESRLDYARGDYRTATSAEELIKALNK